MAGIFTVPVLILLSEAQHFLLQAKMNADHGQLQKGECCLLTFLIGSLDHAAPRHPAYDFNYAPPFVSLFAIKKKREERGKKKHFRHGINARAKKRANIGTQYSIVRPFTDIEITEVNDDTEDGTYSSRSIFFPRFSFFFCFFFSFFPFFFFSFLPFLLFSRILSRSRVQTCREG